MFSDDVSIIVVSCAAGCATVLESEIAALGMKVTWRGETAVETEGTLDDCMKLNLHLRTGHRVFYMVGGYSGVEHPDDLYERVVRIPWERYIEQDGYFTVDVSVDTPSIRNDQFAALRVKDAVADRMREACGQRPDSGNEVEEGVGLFLHWTDEDAAVYLNTTGAALSRRGYRVQASQAPMRESLAAAIILSTGWNGEGHFLNPMCGSATLAIEAAWIATRRAPALLRTEFAFMYLKGFDMAAWRAIRQQAIGAIRSVLPGKIIASDLDAAAIASARANAEAAGVAECIEFDVCDIANAPVPEASLDASVIVINPPYGTRMGDTVQLRGLYADMGAYLKANAAAYRGFIFTASPDLADQVGLSAKQELPFFAGALEARLIEYGGYDRSRRNWKTSDDDATGS